MLRTSLMQATILIVDDEKANIRLLELIFQRAGFTNVHSTSDPRQTLSLFRTLRPDLVLLDLAMPYLNGLEVIGQLLPEMTASPVPILVLTADATTTARHAALRAGAKDFLTKPLDEVDVVLRTNNLLGARLHSVLLEAQVRERTHALEQAQLETLQRLALAAEYRDDDTGLHTRRVGLSAGRIAAALGLPAAQVEILRRAAPLHDVGKIGIPDAILLKPGKLTAEEVVTMQRHTTIGEALLAGSSSPWLQLAAEIALTHHERWDGTGYPAGLAGTDIALTGRIVAVADVFDALTHVRPYKPAWPVDEALAEIERQSGRQFDPCVVTAFRETTATPDD